MYTRRKFFILLVFGATNRPPDRTTVAIAKRPRRRGVVNDSQTFGERRAFCPLSFIPGDEYVAQQNDG